MRNLQKSGHDYLLRTLESGPRTIQLMESLLVQHIGVMSEYTSSVVRLANSQSGPRGSSSEPFPAALSEDHMARELVLDVLKKCDFSDPRPSCQFLSPFAQPKLEEWKTRKFQREWIT